jgi:hypothetical protein
MSQGAAPRVLEQLRCGAITSSTESQVHHMVEAAAQGKSSSCPSSALLTIDRF